MGSFHNPPARSIKRIPFLCVYFFLPAAECAEYNPSSVFFPQPGSLHRPCLHTNAASESLSPSAAQLPCGPKFSLITPHHASARRSRLTAAGFQFRRREGFAWSHFFPRSAGFGPTASKGKEAFTAAPSMHCHNQAIPSISSYSANPFRQRRENTPLRFHSRKYLWIELAFPNSVLGNAFHLQPVRKTKRMPSKTLRDSRGLRPPPGRRIYRRFLIRFGFGISGLTRSQSSSDTTQDLIAFMIQCITRAPFITGYYLRMSSQYPYVAIFKPLSALLFLNHTHELSIYESKLHQIS